MSTINKKNAVSPTICESCGHSDRPTLLMLCDGKTANGTECQRAGHTFCKGFGIDVPKGNWYCSVCAVNVDNLTKQVAASMDIEVVVDLTDRKCKVCENVNNQNKLLHCGKCACDMHYYCLGYSAMPFSAVSSAVPNGATNAWLCPKCKNVNIDPPFIPNGAKAHIYERVSSVAQDNPQFGRVGLQTQNSMCLTYALNKGFVVESTTRDIGSGRQTLNLPNLRLVLQKIKTGEILLIYSVSRFGRNLQQVTQNLQKLHNNGAYVYSVSDKVYGNDPRFLQLAQEAENESNRTSQVIRDANQRRKQQGAYMKRVAPFGFAIAKDGLGIRRVVIEPNEQKVIADIFTIGNTLTFKDIAGKLNLSGYFNRNKAWESKDIVALSKYAKYGDYAYPVTHLYIENGKDLIKDTIPSILTPSDIKQKYNIKGNLKYGDMVLNDNIQFLCYDLVGYKSVTIC